MQPPEFSSTAPYIAWYAYHEPWSTAVVEDSLQVSYQDLAADLARCVHALEQRGVASGMLIGVEVRHKRYLHLLLLLACEVIGTTTTSLAQQEIRSDDALLRRCDVLLLSETSTADHRALTLTIRGGWLDELAAMPPNPDYLNVLKRDVRPDLTTRIVRTSGTTGLPKAIAMSGVTQQRIITRHMDRVPPEIRINAKFLCLYNFAVRAMHLRSLGILQHGGTLLLAKEDHAHNLLGAGAVNYAAFIVGDMERIIQRAIPPPAGHDLQIELIGAIASPRLRRLIRERLRARICTRYSSNETNMIADTDDNNVGTVCASAAVRIVDATGNDKPFGETGLIRVKTDTMADGYYDDPVLTAAAFVDGWYLTNDVGYMPEPGKLVVLGRADDMLNIGGVKLPSLPIEEDIRQITGISDVAVMTIESPYQVDALFVAVEIVGDRPAANLRADIGQILLRYVRTFEIMLLPWFPRTETGKIRRQDIKAAFHRNQQHGRSLTS